MRVSPHWPAPVQRPAVVKLPTPALAAMLHLPSPPSGGLEAVECDVWVARRLQLPDCENVGDITEVSAWPQAACQVRWPLSLAEAVAMLSKVAAVGSLTGGCV